MRPAGKVVSRLWAFSSCAVRSPLHTIDVLAAVQRGRRPTVRVYKPENRVHAHGGGWGTRELKTRQFETVDAQRSPTASSSRTSTTHSEWKSVTPSVFSASPVLRGRNDTWQSLMPSCNFTSSSLKGLDQVGATTLGRICGKHENEKFCWELRHPKVYLSTEREYEPDFEEVIVGAVTEGKVVRVCVSEGQLVPKDAMLLRLEVGVVESLMRAPFRGTVASVAVRQGDKVTRGQPVLVMLPQPDV